MREHLGCQEQREKKTRVPVKPATHSKGAFSLRVSVTPLSPRAASCARTAADALPAGGRPPCSGQRCPSPASAAPQDRCPAVVGGSEQSGTDPNPSCPVPAPACRAAKGARRVSAGLRLRAKPASSTSFAHAGTENPLVVTARLFLRGGGQLRVLLTSSAPPRPSPGLVPSTGCVLLQPPGAGSTRILALPWDLSHGRTNTKRTENAEVFQLPPSSVPGTVFHTNI